ncbi:uncharacterized protein C8Q71DRAFT_161276 [Rhodofomes roseus]|uniref:Uncharacterized protein n=1 Tax=Rhodofomes roseus TaxID=34475 RepID=A0ABQ8KAD9_9APHY|nr:uncharacterized protein C8Q71DRAFT_161276 [Rhodofomes roseus]KAH9834114.1 hypothetical protein C8Q71DRAFT_161276 [Rhodofomes roseus]
MPQQDDAEKATAAPRDYTSEKGSQIDEKRQKAAENDLIQSWMSRLQLISVITTFFATLEAQLLGSITPTESEPTTQLQIVACTVLAGAFAIHLSGAILAFLSSFFLVGYRIKEVTEEEFQSEAEGRPSLESTRSSNLILRSLWTTTGSPHLEQIGPFRGGPPMRLLEHCHTLCMWFSVTGFALALAGGICYSWVRLPQSASILASICLGICWIAGAGAVLVVL